MIFKYFGKDFNSVTGVLTLRAAEVIGHPKKDGNYSKLHEDGWLITAAVKSDGRYIWVSEFVAEHKDLGRVWGDFADTVRASNSDGYEDFVKKHTPESWDPNNPAGLHKVSARPWE